METIHFIGFLRRVCHSFDTFLLAALFSASWVGPELNASAFSVAPEVVRIGDCYTLQVENGAGITLDLRYRHNQGPVQTIQGRPTLDDAGTSRICTSPDTLLGHYEFTGYKNTLSRDWILISKSLEVVPAREDIDLTAVGQGISVTSENQIVLELMPEDIVPANPLDLAGRTLLFTPAGDGYTREVRPLDWEEEAADAEELRGPVEVELEHFRFPFAGREWDSFFHGGDGRPGLISFGKPIPSDYEWPRRFGTMPQILDLLPIAPMISALFKPHLDGDVRVSHLPDRVIVGFFAWDPWYAVYGRRPQEAFDFQIVLHPDGRIAFNYGPEPQDPDEAFGDGIVGLFPGVVVKTSLLGSITDPEDRSLPGHLDLVETAVYTTDEPNRVLVELTTRAPIRPLPGQELIYMVEFDVDEPFTDERDDRDLLAGVTVLPDGVLEARWEASRAAFGAHENRIGLLVDLHAIAARSASVSGRSGTTNSITGAWSHGDGGRPDVVMFPEVAASAPIDLSRPDSRPSSVQHEAFRYPMIRDEGIADVSCRIIEVLGDAFDFMAFNSQFRVDQQAPGPAHGGHGGYYWGNLNPRVEGIGHGEDKWSATTPCESRLTNTWGYPVWIKARTVVYEEFDGQTPYDPGLTQFAHEIAHTWVAAAGYLKDGEWRWPLDGSGHWTLALHTSAPFPWSGSEDGSIMGGAYWRENSDGTFTSTNGWWTKGGGFSWLDLYLMGLATPDEVPDMFILNNLELVGARRDGRYTADKEIVTMGQILAAMGPRNPPAERARKVFNTGFVYFLLPGQEPNPELLREHADYRDRAVAHWSHVTGGRGRLTTELPVRRQ